MHKLFWGFFAVCAVGALMRGMPEDEAAVGAGDVETPFGNLAMADGAPSGASDDTGGSWYSGDIELNRERDGHFYAQPTIGGSRINVLVDTGASFVALTGDDADAAGIFWSRSDMRPVARGASGMVEGVPVMIDSIELDGTEIRNVEAAVIPDGLDVTLLGQSFLQRFDRVQIEGDKMVLSPD